MRYCFILLYLLTLFINGIRAQNREIDSLQNLINQLDTQDKTNLKREIDLRENLIQTKIQINLREGMEKDLAALGRCHLLRKDSLSYFNTVYLTKAVWQSKLTSDVGNALVNYQRYFTEVEKINKKDSINPYVYIDIGNLYIRLEIRESAWRYYKMAETAFRKKDNQEALVTVYNNMAQVGVHQRLWDTATVYTQKAVTLSQQIKDTVLLAFSYSVSARIPQEQRNYQEARRLFLLALKLIAAKGIEKNKNFRHHSFMPASTCLQLGKCYYEDDMLSQSRLYLDSADYFLDKYELNYVEGRAKIAYWKVKVLMKEQQWEKAVKLANSYLKNKNQSNDTLLLNMYMYENLYNIYKSLGQTDKMNEWGYKFYQHKFNNQQNTYDDKLLMTNNLVLQLQNEQIINNQNLTIETQRFNAAQEAKVRFYLWLALSLVGLVLLVIIVSFFYLRRQNELIKRYSSELEKSNKDKELLLSVIGHDVRSPFQSIFNNIDQVYTHFDVAKQSSILQKLAQAKKSAEQVFVLLDNLLQWVVLQKQQIKPQKEQVNLNVLLQDLKKLFANMNLLEHLRLEISDDLPHLQADKALITIVFRNLLLNAIKYSSMDSVVNVSYKIIDNQYIVEIENEIEVVSDALIHRINSYKQKQDKVFKGGGLGLRLVDEIADKIGIKLVISNHKSKKILTQVIFPLATYPIANFSPAEQLHTSAPTTATAPAYIFNFQSENKSEWENFIAAISTCEVYEASRIKTILQKTALWTNAGGQEWQTDLNNAVRQLDEERFRELIQILQKSFYEHIF